VPWFRGLFGSHLGFVICVVFGRVWFLCDQKASMELLLLNEGASWSEHEAGVRNDFPS
jgi:hypothetical protein